LQGDSEPNMQKKTFSRNSAKKKTENLVLIALAVIVNRAKYHAIMNTLFQPLDRKTYRRNSRDEKKHSRKTADTKGMKDEKGGEGGQ